MSATNGAYPIGPLGEPYDRRAWTTGSPPCGPCGRGEHGECSGGFEDLAGYRDCICPVCFPRPEAPQPAPREARGERCGRCGGRRRVETMDGPEACPACCRDDEGPADD